MSTFAAVTAHTMATRLKTAKRKKRDEAEEKANKDQALISSSSFNPNSAFVFFADSLSICRTTTFYSKTSRYSNWNLVNRWHWKNAPSSSEKRPHHSYCPSEQSIIKQSHQRCPLRAWPWYQPFLGCCCYQLWIGSPFLQRYGLLSSWWWPRTDRKTFRQHSLSPRSQTSHRFYHINKAHWLGIQSRSTSFNTSLAVKRLGHINHQTILKMVSKELISGLHLTNEKIPKTLCAACEVRKFHWQPLKIGRTRANRNGELVHSDVESPIPSPSVGQARYYVLFTDDFSGWRVTYFMNCKSKVQFPA